MVAAGARDILIPAGMQKVFISGPSPKQERLLSFGGTLRARIEDLQPCIWCYWRCSPSLGQRCGAVPGEL
jgi:hypothetical protein